MEQWKSAEGAHRAIKNTAPTIQSALDAATGLDEAVYEQAREAYLHLAADRIAEIRVTAEWLERILIDEAKAAGLPLAPLAKITGRGTGTVSRWGAHPLMEDEDGAYGPGTITTRRPPRDVRGERPRGGAVR